MSKRQTVFFTAVNLLNKEHKDPNEIDLEAPRLAWCYKQRKWRRHQGTVYWVDIQLAQLKGFKFYQTRSNAVIFYNTLPACCIPKVIMMETGEIIYYIFLRHLDFLQRFPSTDNWMKELDSEVAEEVVKTSSKSNQKPKNPIIKNRETCQ